MKTSDKITYMAIQEVELTIPGEHKGEPIFHYISTHFQVIPNILEASFSTEMGWAIVRFEGQEGELTRLFDFLIDKGVKIESR